MKRIIHIPAFSLICLLLISLAQSSCSQDDFPGNGLIAEEDVISFHAHVPGVTTRSTYDLSTEIPFAGFTVSALCHESAGADGRIPVHFENQTVSRQADNIFRSDSCKWPSNKFDPINKLDPTGYLKFFAFHPSIAEMKQRAGAGNECFEFTNSSTKDNSGIKYDYRLTKFRMIPDISKQVDFVSAIGEGNKTTDLYSDVKIGFEHQFAGVEINVWGGSKLYDVEVAGVRIGGTIVEADFNLSTEISNPGDNGNTLGSWVITDKAKYGYVDYVFTDGDKVIEINENSHNTFAKAASIMGNGGKAMVIPYKHEKWDHTNDKKNTANGMYFSALIRMYEHDGDHHCIYPSTDPQSQDYIVYLSVLKSDGTVKQRLDKNGNIYGTTTPYNKPDNEEIRTYGWAAAPSNVDWKAGYTYSYVLDYSNGVGVHDPCDLNPGAPMIDWGGVEITTATGEWNSGSIITEGSWGANSNNTAPDGTVWWK